MAGAVDMMQWNEAQGQLIQDLRDAGEPTLEAFLTASFSFHDGMFHVEIRGKAHRNIGEEHPAYPILSRKGTGQGSNLGQAIRQALQSR